MPKKLTEQERSERKIIQNRLNEFGANVTNESKKLVRVRTGRLKDTLNYRVKPYNVVSFAQQYYGKFNKDKSNKEYNPFLREIERQKGDLKNIIVKDLRESILYKYKNDKPNNNIN